MSIESDLLDARPGDVVTFSGRQKVGKVIGIRGQQGNPITLRGADDTAVIIPSPDYLYALLRFEQSAHLRLEHFRLDGEGRAQRAIQIFTSEFVDLDWLESENCQEDHFHFAGSDDCSVKHCRFDGTGGVNMGGGKAGHAIYVTKIDGGGDVARHLWEDCECTDIAGSAWQANGDGRTVHELVARRMAATDWGKYGGALFNLATVDGATLEDVYGETRHDSGGVRAYEGSRAITLNRFFITNPDGEETDGPVTVISRAPPAAPNFDEDVTPEPPEPGPEPEPEEGRQYCPTCQGDGTQLGPDGESMPCATCEGLGTVPLPT